MKITDEVVELARKAADEINAGGSAYFVVLGAFEALSASPAGVKPKPLDWEYDEEGWYSVQTVCGPYEARVTDRGTVRIRKPSEAWQTFEGDIDAAFAFLFADYSARIMSAIEPAGVGVETPPPSTHLRGDDEHWQGLLAAQNNNIDGLLAENEKLRKALEPFAEVAGRFDAVPVSAILPQQCWFTPHSLREARAALVATEGSDNG